MSLLDSLGAGPGDEQPDGYEGRHRDPYDRTAVEGEGRWGRLVEARRPLGRRIAVAAVVAAVVGASVCVGLVVAAAAVIW